MPSLAALDFTTWVGDHDMTTRMNELSLSVSVEAQEDTRYGTNGAHRVGRSRIAGLEDIESELNGFWDWPVDEDISDGLGTTDQVVTHSVSGAETDVAYLYTSRKFSYQTFGEVGSVTPFTLSMQGSRGTGSPGAIRGQVAAAKQDVSATGVVGSVVNLGDVAAGEYLYAAVHAFTAGDSISIDVESDSDSTFPSPTVQMSFSLSAAGGTLQRTPGTITDTHYRLSVSANTGTFNLAGVIGVK